MLEEYAWVKQMYNLLPQKAPYICISPRKMAGNYIDMQGSVSTDLGKLVNIQLVPRKRAESNRETAILQQQENFRSFVTTGNQQPYNGTYSWGIDSTVSPVWTHREQNPSVPESLRKARSCPAQLVTGNPLQTQRRMSAGPCIHPPLQGGHSLALHFLCTHTRNP